MGEAAIVKPEIPIEVVPVSRNGRTWLAYYLAIALILCVVAQAGLGITAVYLGSGPGGEAFKNWGILENILRDLATIEIALVSGLFGYIKSAS